MKNAITAYIGLGSNLGDGLKILRQAWRELESWTEISTMLISDPYLSEPVGMASSNWFTNAVGKLQTTLTAEELLQCLMETEAGFGRSRDAGKAGYQDRILDLDMLYFGAAVQQSPSLVLPHPHLSHRLFVLEPLAEIAPHFRDPLDHLTIEEKRARLYAGMEEGSTGIQQINRAGWPQED